MRAKTGRSKPPQQPAMSAGSGPFDVHDRCPGDRAIPTRIRRSGYPTSVVTTRHQPQSINRRLRAHRHRADVEITAKCAVPVDRHHLRSCRWKATIVSIGDDRPHGGLLQDAATSTEAIVGARHAGEDRPIETTATTRRVLRARVHSMSTTVIPETGRSQLESVGRATPRLSLQPGTSPSQ